jgi:hypothetical protein
MNNLLVLTSQTFQHLLQKVLSCGGKKDDVPPEVKEAIQQCQTMEDLLDLLFATDFNKDEQVIALFERRMEEIEPSF